MTDFDCTRGYEVPEANTLTKQKLARMGEFFDKAIEQAKAAILPFESWERLKGETSFAFAAFCAYRDFGPERNIRKAVESAVKEEHLWGKRYKVWLNWCRQFRWQERAADFDRYMERLKQNELRKTIEAQGEKHREVTGKMLDVVSKKLDLIDPAELSQGAVTEWVQTAIKADREAAGLVSGNGKPVMKQGEIGQFAGANCLGVSTGRNSTQQGELVFTSEFDGL